MKMAPRSGKSKKQPVFSERERDFMDKLLGAAVPAGWMVYHTYDSRRSTAGFPDLVLVKPPVVVFAELKTEKGTPSKAQDEWLEQLGLCTDLSVHLWRPSDWDEIEERLGFIRQGTSPY
jgi:Holliday junction resolvase